MLRNILVICIVAFASTIAQAGAYDDILAAANNGETASVIDLIRRGMDINTADPNGSTLLMIAARTGNVELVDTLLAARANVNRRNQFGDTAIHVAALKGRIEIVSRLLDKGAEVDSAGWTPLHYAVFGGSVEVAGLLREKGAKLDARAPNGQTALMLAVRSQNLALVRLLIDADADMDLADFDGLTAIGLARKLGHTEIADYLKKEGAVE